MTAVTANTGGNLIGQRRRPGKKKKAVAHQAKVAGASWNTRSQRGQKGRQNEEDAMRDEG